MSEPKSPAIKASFGQKLGASAYRIFCGILRLLDIRFVAIIGRCIGYLTWAVMPGRRRIVARNLRIAVDPSLKGRALSSLVRRNIVRTCMNMACTFKTGLMTDAEFERSVTVVGRDRFEEMAAYGDCVVGCIPHAGNWEVLARIRPLFPKVKRFGSMYRRLDNPVLEDIVYKSRTAYGCEMFSSQKGLKEVFRLANEGGMLGVLSDQFTQQGIFLPYFGKVTGTTPLPSLIYKRCKGRGHLVAVSTRNTGLGKWDAILSHEVPVPADETSSVYITQAVNTALEEVQRASILDGFWMHHRWKSTSAFAPGFDDEQKEMIGKYAKLPFRVIVCVPESFEESVLTIPFLRELAISRPDMQIILLCPPMQQAFWKTQNYIGHTVTTENTFAQLDEEKIYNEGPIDYLFMLSDNRKVFAELRKLMPFYISGFRSNSLSRKFRTKFVLPVGAEPQHRAQEYIQLLSKGHYVSVTGVAYADSSKGASDVSGNFIAPFSTLGSADTWEAAKWKELIERLEGGATLLAFEQDKSAAEALAAELGVACTIVQPETVHTVLGPNCHLYAVDGLLPQLAALVGCRCSVIMASRLAAVYAPLGEGHRVVYRHTPCHPCYRSKCDQQTCCTAGVSVDELLGV